MSTQDYAPEEMESALNKKAELEVPEAGRSERSEQVRAEGFVAARHWGGVQYRIIVTFLVFSVCWVAVVSLGMSGAIPLWLGLIVNSVISSTFYMPMHEATHRNIMGKSARGRGVEDLIGRLASIPTGIQFSSHRAAHMRHHAYTNDPDRDPDHFTSGRMRELPAKFYGVTMLNAFLPVFALVRPTRVLLPVPIKQKLASRDGSKEEGKAQLRFWLLTTVVLVVSAVTGRFAEAMLLWWLPARIQFCWLMFIFAWYPHHPASETSRYRHTRVAVFRGSGMLIRGHDYHAIHHLYPRVPHYRLKHLWNELSSDLVDRGVRAEGRALGATSPVVW